MNRLRIGYVIDTIETPAAGTEKQLLMLLNNLDREKFLPYLICLRNSEWLNKQQFTFPVMVYDVQAITSFNMLHFLRRFIRFLKEEKLDIVQTFFVDANIFGTLGAKLAGVPVILSSRRNMGDWHNRKHVIALRFLRRWTSHYVANSQAAAQKTIEVEGVSPEAMSVFYNGLELQRYENLTDELREKQRREWGVKPEEILVGTVANLRPVKNVASFISAAARLAPEFPSLKFVAVGDGYERPVLEEQVARLGLTGIFHFAGRLTDTVPCLAAFDIAVMCSKFESFSNALIEYMAAGLPIVASRVGGNAEAVEHEVTGLLYDIDDEHGLENGVRRLLTDREFALSLGKAAKEKAAGSFSREAYVKTHEEFYERIFQRLVSRKKS